MDTRTPFLIAVLLCCPILASCSDSAPQGAGPGEGGDASFDATQGDATGAGAPGADAASSDAAWADATATDATADAASDDASDGGVTDGNVGDSASSDALADGSSSGDAAASSDAPGPVIDAGGDAGDAASAEGGHPVTDGPSADAGAPAHAYVANFDNGSLGNIEVYDRPLSASSTPALTLDASNGLSAPNALRVNPSGTQLWVSDFGVHEIFAFSLPLTSSSQPVTTLATGAEPVDLLFDASGNLWVAEFSGRIEEWAGPNPSGTSTKTLQTGGGNVFALAIADGTLYAAGPTSPQLYAFANPLTGGASPTLFNSHFADPISGLIVIGGKLYADSYTSYALGFTTLPLTAASTFTNVGAVVASPEQLRLSPGGQLVVPSNGSQARISFLTAPDFATLDFSWTSGLLDPRCLEYGP